MKTPIHAKLFAAACFAVLLGLACGGNPPRSDTGPKKPVGEKTTPPRDDEPAAKPAIQARGEGSSEADAYADALTGLESQLYGSNLWAEALDVPIHDRQRDPFEATTESGLTRVTLGLTRERVAEALGRLEEKPWSPLAPEPLSEVISRAAGVHIAALVCQRRQALLQEPCEPPEVDPIAAIDEELRALAESIRLRSFYAGGVPVNGDNRPLRPVIVVVEHRSGGSLWLPLPGLQVALRPGEDSGPGALDAFTSDATSSTDPKGQARFEFSGTATWPAGVRVEIAHRALLGPLADIWPVKGITLAGREIAIGRWSLIATERVQGEATNQRAFTTNARRILGKSVVLPGDLAAELASASPEALAGKLPALADEQEGRIDVLFVADIDSDYAGRLSTSRVWYEARGKIRVYNAWTGELITTVEHTVKESGVGEPRADRAARSKLAEALAGKLLEVSL